MHRTFQTLVAGAILVSAACGNGPSQPSHISGTTSGSNALNPGTSPEPRASLTVESTDASLPWPIMGLTPLRLDASGSTGESLSYLIDVGDGATSSEKRIVHSSMASGSLTARLTVTDKYGRTDSVTVPYDVMSLVRISGWRNWSGNYYRDLHIDKHEGRIFSGRYFRWRAGESGEPGIAFHGTLREDRNIALVFDDGSSWADGVVTDPLRGYCDIFPQLRLKIQGTNPDSGSTLLFEIYYSGC